VEENRERLEESSVDASEFEGKDLAEILPRKYEELVQRMKTIKVRRRELCEE